MLTTIRKYRKQQRLTLRELALQSHISVGRLSEYEHGENIPLQRLRRLTKILNIPTGDLFVEEDDTQGATAGVGEEP
jgi:transcriptional regulator with XRE-family HTH domain